MNTPRFRAGIVILCALTGTSVRAAADASFSPAPRTFQPARAVAADTLAADSAVAYLLSLFAEDRSSIERYYWTSWSLRGFDRRSRFVDEWSGRLEATDFDSLGVQGRIDWLLLRREIERERDRVVLARARLEEMRPLLPMCEEIARLEEARWTLDGPDAPTAAAMLSSVAPALKEARARIERGAALKEGEAVPADAVRVSPVVALRASHAVGAARSALNVWFGHYDGFQPDFAWWTRTPRAEADAALAEYARFLREDIAAQKGTPDDPLVGDPIGREALLSDLRSELLAYTPEDLIAIAEREAAWCHERLREASREMGLGDDWRAAVERVKGLHAPVGAQDRLVVEQSREIIAWLRERDLVTIPALAEETWRVRMNGPDGQRVLPFAAYDDQTMVVSFPTDSMPHADKLMSLRGNNEHFTRIVTPHELIPGHHLQSFMSARHRPYRGAFSTPFYVEGWALYWEMLLWDRAWARSPEDRVGMLFWRLHRCMRIVVSLRFHLGEMTTQQMIDRLVDDVGHERLSATSEVRRYVGGDYSPLYQCAYMIGGLQLRSLAAEAGATGNAGPKGEKWFNDLVMAQGPIPIDLVRFAALDRRPEKADAGRWRFDVPVTLKREKQE